MIKKITGVNPNIPIIGTSLVVQWLRLHISTAGGTGLILSWGTKISNAAQCGE